jgi:DNA invertase Pin-like site-specific DNA recombinase
LSGSAAIAVAAYAKASGARIVKTFTEVESGRKNDRPELQRAIAHAKRANARLVIARLGRLSRNAAFLMALMDSGVEFVACDMPEADETMVGVMALMAQREAKLISERTGAALQAAKARGVKLGKDNLTEAAKARGRVLGTAALKAGSDAFAADLGPVVRELRGAGRSLRDIAAHLDREGFATRRGGAWTATQVLRVLDRAAG